MFVICLISLFIGSFYIGSFVTLYFVGVGVDRRSAKMHVYMGIIYLSIAIAILLFYSARWWGVIIIMSVLIALGALISLVITVLSRLLKHRR